MLVLDIVTSSLRQIGIIGESEDPSSEQGQDATEKLNDMMFELRGKGVDLGWNPKADTADTAVLPLEWVKGIKAQLAVYLAAEYGVADVPPKVIADAMESESRMIRDALVNQFKTQRLDALPFGETSGYVYDITRGY